MEQSLYYNTIFIGTILCQLWIIAASINNRNKHYVPSIVQPGHIITVFPYVESGTKSKIHSSSIGNEIHKYFSFYNKNVFVTTSNISALQDQTVSVSIQNISPTKQWKEFHTIKIGQSIPAIHFSNTPYFGVIRENKPIGTAIVGLDNMIKSVQMFPKNCKFSLDGGDVQHFKLGSTSHGVLQITSKVSLDREVKSSYYIIIKAQCQKDAAAYAHIHIAVSDVNDNSPAFDLNVYTTSLNLEDVEQNKEIIKVHAVDADYSNDITYSLTGTEAFTIDQLQGIITIGKPQLLASGESYDFNALAQDQGGHISKPTTVRVTIKDTPLVKLFQYTDNNIHLVKRALRDDRKFVVRSSQTGNLFSVASIPSITEEQYSFASPEPTNLQLDSDTGMITRMTEHTWNATMVNFFVNISRIDDPTYNDQLQVIVYVISATWEDPIFSNQPAPLWTRIPVWIRPFTIIYTVKASAAEEFNTPVKYKLQSGGNGQFAVDPVTGDVKVNWRGQFVPDNVYALAISAQSIGAAPMTHTPSQVLYVKVGDLNPQFYLRPYVINVSETTNVGDSIGMLKAVSFQDLPLTFSWVLNNPSDSAKFDLHPNTGDITLRQKLVYIQLHRVQYRMKATVVESNSNLQSTVEVIINLIPQNLHAPFFPPTHYIQVNISENVANATSILNVIGVDLDPGNLGLMDFTVQHPKFFIDSIDGKTGILKSLGSLDYDFAGPEHMYEFTITATDRDPENPRSGSTTVQIWLSNINDESPVFYPPNQVVHLTENTDINVPFITYVQAHDPDGDRITFKFVDCTSGNGQGTICGIFDINPTTGEIKLNARVPPGSQNQVLTVEVSDDGSCCPSDPNPQIHRTMGTVTINYVGVNHPPSFPKCSTDNFFNSASVDEGMPAGTPVLNITAEDNDAGENGKLVFSIVKDSRIPDYFAVKEISANTAEVYTLKEFNREDPDNGNVYIDGKIKYKVTVLATDKGRPQLSATCFFFVGINDVNDHAPIFDGLTYEATISKTTQLGHEFLKVFAIDDDEGATAKVTYSIVTQRNLCAGGPCYAINPNTGWIRVAGTIPDSVTESKLVVRAQDGGSQPRNTNVNVTITRTSDTSILPPNWELIDGKRIDDITLVIPENVPRNTRLEISPRATVPGVTGEVTYFLWRGRTKAENSDRDFNGFPNTSANVFELFAAGAFDNAITSQYTLKLIASRKSSTSVYSNAYVKVNVSDVNDQKPLFEGFDLIGKYSAAVSDETKVGDLVIRVIAIDLDTKFPNNWVRYRWASTCGSDCDAFTLQNDTGRILANQVFNRKAKQKYLLTVVAYDGAPSALPNVPDNKPNEEQADVTVLVLGPSEESPSFKKTRYDFVINEGQPMYENFANVTANDPDPDFNFPQYIISSGNEKHKFAVNTDTGMIVTTGDLLYAKQQSYDLKYNVFDGRNIDTTQVVINLTSINMYPPLFSKPIFESTQYTEEQVKVPAFLVQAGAIDPDASNRNSQITYSLEGAFDTDDRFQVDASGNVYLNEAKIERDYPNGYANWQINIVANDEAPLTSRKGYAVLDVKLKDINDNHPYFDACCVAGSVPENSSPDTSVLQLKARDVDFGNNATLVYEAVRIPENNSQPIFSLSSTGLIRTASVPLDREQRDTYTMVVRVRDEGVPPKYSLYNQTVYITVTDANDHSPYFDPVTYVFDMNERIPVGGIVNYVQGVDRDIGDNAKLTFQVSGGRDMDYFYMDSIYVSKTGVIKIKKEVKYNDLPTNDKELRIEVNVTDPTRPGTNSPATVTINVLDINDNAPVFTPSSDNVTVPENVAVDTELATFTATDVDTGNNKQFSYYIDYANTDQEKKFTIDSNTGVVKIRNSLDREVQAGYAVHILAIDNGIPAMTGTAILYVTVTDINDNAPNFPPGLPPVVVGPSTTKNSIVLDFIAVDPDAPNNGPPFTITYCTNPGCSDFTFTQQGGTRGVLRANRNNYNTNELGRNSYNLEFTMSDNPTSGNPQQTAVRTLHVLIESGNDNRMIEAGSEKSVVVFNYMGTFNNVPCGQVYVNDLDGNSDLADKTFTCTKGCERKVRIENGERQEEYFSVNADNGEVRMLEGAPSGSHTLKVSVFDQKWSQTIIATVRVQVIYIEEDAVLSSGSMRLQDVTAEEMIGSKLQSFQNVLANLLGTDKDNVEVFTVLNVPGKSRMVDVQFAAHGSPYYSPARMNGIVWSNKNSIENTVNIKMVSSPVDQCLKETCFSGGCTNRKLTSTAPALVNTGATSFVGINTTFEFECACQSSMYQDSAPKCDAYSCMNGGKCTENWNGFTCACQKGFEGPRCQNTKISFDGNSYAWFESLGTSQCSDFRLSFDFITSSPDGLILYNGPVTNQNQAPGLKDFISVALEGSKAKVWIDLGDGEVVLKVDGANTKSLNDGTWHSIEVVKEFKTVRLIVDHCDNSVVDETVNTTSQDVTPCEASATLTGDQFLLNVFTPLELGGRSKPDVDYPTNLPTVGFNGCIKNVMYNDLLYDLDLSRTEKFGNPSNGCSRELGCVADVDSSCPLASTCTGNFNDANRVCVCDPGFRGAQCNEETTVKAFDGDSSFIEWELRPQFNNSLNPKYIEIWLRFRTRSDDGVLFTASSFSTLERIQIELVDTHLQVRYDFGSNDKIVQLSYVNVSDGIWHNTYVMRYGNQVILKLDFSDGKYFNESLPNPEHQLIYVSDERQVYGGAEVYYKKYHTTPTITKMLVASCVSDYRINQVNYFPLDASDDTTSARIVQQPGMVDGCPSNACNNVICPETMICEDRWRIPFCICPIGFTIDPLSTSICIPITDCSINRCDHGVCVTVGGLWRCNCDEGYYGEICDKKDEIIAGASVGLATGAIVAIAICILVLLLLILIIILLVQRKRSDPLLIDPKDDIRENVVYYDEEGAGEEDMHAYDLSRLQKPIHPGDVVMAAGKPDEYPRRDMAPLAGAPEPMSDPRRPYLPGDRPEVGDFIGDRLGDADNDPNAPPYDSVREYEYEGGGSSAGSLSSLQSSSSGDLDFDYLNDYGPRFQKLADMYGAGQGDEGD